MPRITVKALWLQPNVGMRGYIGAILEDGTPVALCSKEKWDMGPDDSLREGWFDNVRIGLKTFSNSYSTAELKLDGLGSGKLQLTVPEYLVPLTSIEPAPDIMC